jgi:hypothetical protein
MQNIKIKDNPQPFINQDKLFKAYKIAGINRECVEIMNEFITNLLTNLHTTYLGNYLKTDKDIEGHYNWCFTKTISKFKYLDYKEKYSTELKDYFFVHAIAYIYSNKNYNYNDNEDLNLDLHFYNMILDFFSQKTDKELIVMVELYSIMKICLF